MALAETLNRLSPLQLNDELVRYPPDQKSEQGGHTNPNWIAATPREAFFLLGQFALSEARRTRDEGSLAGMPSEAALAARMRAFLHRAGSSAGEALLRRGIDYATSTLGFDADAIVEINQRGVAADGPHASQYPDEEIFKLADPRVTGGAEGSARGRLHANIPPRIVPFRMRR
jgi:aspartate 4-decarboxylase